MRPPAPRPLLFALVGLALTACRQPPFDYAPAAPSEAAGTAGEGALLSRGADQAKYKAKAVVRFWDVPEEAKRARPAKTAEGPAMVYPLDSYAPGWPRVRAADLAAAFAADLEAARLFETVRVLGPGETPGADETLELNVSYKEASLAELDSLHGTYALSAYVNAVTRAGGLEAGGLPGFYGTDLRLQRPRSGRRPALELNDLLQEADAGIIRGLDYAYAERLEAARREKERATGNGEAQ